MSTSQRLQKVLASAGVASRRHSEELILDGRVKVNGQIVRELGSKADPLRDRIEVDGQPLPKPSEHVYLALHKPQGYVTTVKDPRRRRTVMDLVPEVPGMHPVGRLDYDTSGLLLLTNDGDFTLAMTHPRFGLAKTYQATLRGRPSELALQKLREGIVLDDGPTRPAEVIRLGHEGGATLVQVTLHEGRNRQVRRMFEAIGHPVHRLKRTSVGPVSLGTLAPGQARPLGPEEIAMLFRLARKEEKA
jgi:pseudouridine synthase